MKIFTLPFAVVTMAVLAAGTATAAFVSTPERVTSASSLEPSPTVLEYTTSPVTVYGTPPARRTPAIKKSPSPKQDFPTAYPRKSFDGWLYRTVGK